jgi:hypothetical protein
MSLVKYCKEGCINRITILVMFWVVTLYSAVVGYLCFGGPCHHNQKTMTRVFITVITQNLASGLL